MSPYLKGYTPINKMTQGSPCGRWPLSMVVRLHCMILRY